MPSDTTTQDLAQQPLFSTQLGAALLAGALGGAYTAVVMALRSESLAAWPFAEEAVRFLKSSPLILITIPRKILMFCGPAIAQRSWRVFFWAVFFGLLYHATHRLANRTNWGFLLPEDTFLGLLPKHLAAELPYVFLVARHRGFKIGPLRSYLYVVVFAVCMTVLHFVTSSEFGWITDRADGRYIRSISNLLWTPLLVVLVTLGIEQALLKKKPSDADNSTSTSNKA